MKLLEVTPTFYPAVMWGGPIQTTYRLCNALSRQRNTIIRVLTTDSAGPKRGDRVKLDDEAAYNGYEILYCKRDLAATFSFELLRNLPSMIRWADIVHLNAVYSPPTIPTLALCKLMSKPVVWSPRGALQRWVRSSRPRTKSLWDAICNVLCDKSRVTLHFTSEKEQSESAGRIKRASSVVIPNGVEIREDGKSWSEGRKSLRLLYLGRLHPIKGIENLLNALRAVDHSVTLAICGNGDNGYESKLKAMVENLEIGNRVFFLGHVTDEQKCEYLENSDVLVMPSYSESFGLSAAEAMGYGLPIIAGKGTPWSEIEKRECGLWVDNDSESLAEAISRISHMPLSEMGINGRDWMASEFSWEAVARKMSELYRRLVPN